MPVRLWAVALLHLARIAPPGLSVPQVRLPKPRLHVDVDDPDLGRFYAPPYT